MPPIIGDDDNDNDLFNVDRINIDYTYQLYDVDEVHNQPVVAISARKTLKKLLSAYYQGVLSVISIRGLHCHVHDCSTVLQTKCTELMRIERAIETVIVFFGAAHFNSPRAHMNAVTAGFFVHNLKQHFEMATGQLYSIDASLERHRELLRYHERLYCNIVRWGCPIKNFIDSGAWFRMTRLTINKPVITQLYQTLMKFGESFDKRIRKACKRLGDWFRCMRLLARFATGAHNSKRTLHRQVVCRLVLQHSYQFLLPDKHTASQHVKFSAILDAMLARNVFGGAQWMRYFERLNIVGFRKSHNERFDATRVTSLEHVEAVEQRIEALANETMPAPVFYYHLSERWVYPELAQLQ